MEREQLIRLGISLGIALVVMLLMTVAINLVQAFIPIAVLFAGLYAGYRFYNSDLATPGSLEEVEEGTEDLMEVAKNTGNTLQTIAKAGGAIVGSRVKEAAENLPRREDNSDSGDEEVEEEYETFDPEEEAEVVVEANEVVEEAPAEEEAEVEYREVDLDRLAEKEKEEPTVNDAVISQLEERKRRLGMNDDS